MYWDMHCFSKYFISHVVDIFYHDLGLVIFIRGRYTSFMNHVLLD